MEEQIELLKNVMDNTEINAIALEQINEGDYSPLVLAIIRDLNTAVMHLEWLIDELERSRKHD